MKYLLILSLTICIILTNLSYSQTQPGSFIFDGNQRNYMVFLPNNYPGSTNYPLVIYLHCYGWTAQQGMDYTLLYQVADTSDFVIVYPSAIPNWNSGINDNPSWPTPNVDDVGFINALIDTLINNYNIDFERIYACGYSNGGFMSYKLACQLNHRIAAIASVGGVISTNTMTSCTPLHSIPVLQIHGTTDPWVPINGTSGWHSVDQTLGYWINFNSCVQVDTSVLPDLDPNDGCTVEKISYTNCTNNSDVIYYKVINGGHTWPGAGPPGYVAGNTNHDINASVEIWDFFKNHHLITSIESEASSAPSEFPIKQNYPNPFNPSTTIKYTLPKSEKVKIEVFNLLGQKISTLLNKQMPAGSHEVEFTAKDLPSGIYLYRIEAGEYQQVRKMILLR